MKITNEADYALRVVLYLSKLGYGEKIDAKTISDHEAIPLRFLLKLLRKLIKAQIVKSYRGVNGGYALNKMPKEITLKEVIEAIDGSICMNRCLDDPELCSAKKSGRCEIHHALSKVQNKLIKELEDVNFEKLIK